MLVRQKIFAILISIVIFIAIIELVRRKKLRMEYSWFWLMTGTGLFILAVWYDLLVAITKFIGAGFPTSTLFFFGIIFLIMVNLHFTVELSSMANKLKDLIQEIALLKSKNQTGSKDDMGKQI
jgi:hypothetical protein